MGRSLGDIHGVTLLVGAIALAVILAVRFLRPSIPGALVLVVGGIAAARLFDLGAHEVALVGHVPSGLPAPALPSTDIVRAEYPTIIVAAVALLLIGFSQTAGDARAFATRHRYRIDVDQESVAQGVANVGAGVFQGMPVSTSLSASSLNETAGARTPVASLVTGALVILTLIVLAPLFSDLPKAVLAAVIIDAVVFGMIDVAEFRRLRHVVPFDFWISVAARHRRALGRRARRRRHRHRAVPGMADLRGHQPADPGAGARAGHAGVPRPRPAPRATRRSTASSSSAWTAACSSRPRRRWRTGSGTWPTPTGRRCARSSSTSRPSPTWTRRGRSSCVRSWSSSSRRTRPSGWRGSSQRSA